MVYAHAFQIAGFNVRIAADPARCQKYRDHGITFNGTPMHLEYFTPETRSPKADLVIIATKSTGLNAALDLIEQIVGEDTIILTLLNGITSENIAAQKYGWDKVLYSYFIGHTASRTGNDVRQDGKYKTVFGEARNTTLSVRVQRVKSLFDQAQIPYKIAEDMIAALWLKFIINVGMNQATAVLHCTYGHLQNSSPAFDYMKTLMQEAALVARLEGIAGTEEMVEKAVSLLSTLSPEDGSSMYQDVMAARASEVDLFADTVCTLARKHDVETPYNHHAAIILKALKIN